MAKKKNRSSKAASVEAGFEISPDISSSRERNSRDSSISQDRCGDKGSSKR